MWSMVAPKVGVAAQAYLPYNGSNSPHSQKQTDMVCIMNVGPIDVLAFS